MPYETITVSGTNTEAVLIANRRQLFLDDHVVESVQGIRRKVHPATRWEGGSVLEPSGAETFASMRSGVLYNPDKQLFEMWYNPSYASQRHASLINVAYACSKDGIHWEKPQLDAPTHHRLGLLENVTDELMWSPAGSGLAEKAKHYYGRELAGTNVLLPQTECQGIVYTPDDPDPERRYKGLIFGGTIITSPDGIHWRVENTFFPGQLATLSYDPINRLYIAAIGVPPYSQGADWYGRRCAALMVSHDLVTWTSPGGGDLRIALPLTAREIDAPYQGPLKAIRDNPYSNDMPVLIAPDAADDALAYERALVRLQTHGELAYWLPVETGEAHVHDVTILPYEGVYIGFPCKLDNQALTNPYGDDGQMYAELCFSRDLKNWTRYRDMVLPPGPPGAYDGACIDSPKALVVGDEVWVYTQGSAYTHGWPNLHPDYAPKDDEQLARLKRLLAKFEALSGTTLFKWRLDGFVSVSPSRTDTGTLHTRPVVFTGNQLEVNADAGHGRLRVAIQDHEGRALPGYGLDDCKPLTADQVHHVFRWADGNDLTMLAGKAVCLLFELSGQARLYAFQFTGYGPSRQAQARASRPWDFVDLQREIEVGPEVPIDPSEVHPPRIAPHWATNQRCARSGMPILSFDKVRIFQHPKDPEQRLCFLEQCLGKVRIVSQGE